MFSLRDKSTAPSEHWRIPLLTDVLIARLGASLGFEIRELVHARDLQPRNVRDGSMRETLVVMQKPAS
jgi:hypothetical protein